MASGRKESSEGVSALTSLPPPKSASPGSGCCGCVDRPAPERREAGWHPHEVGEARAAKPGGRHWSLTPALSTEPLPVCTVMSETPRGVGLPASHEWVLAPCVLTPAPCPLATSRWPKPPPSLRWKHESPGEGLGRFQRTSRVLRTQLQGPGAPGERVLGTGQGCGCEGAAGPQRQQMSQPFAPLALAGGLPCSPGLASPHLPPALATRPGPGPARRPPCCPCTPPSLPQLSCHPARCDQGEQAEPLPPPTAQPAPRWSTLSPVPCGWRPQRPKALTGGGSQHQAFLGLAYGWFLLAHDALVCTRGGLHFPVRGSPFTCTWHAHSSRTTLSSCLFRWGEEGAMLEASACVPPSDSGLWSVHGARACSSSEITSLFHHQQTRTLTPLTL